MKFRHIFSSLSVLLILASCTQHGVETLEEAELTHANVSIASNPTPYSGSLLTPGQESEHKAFRDVALWVAKPNGQINNGANISAGHSFADNNSVRNINVRLPLGQQDLFVYALGYNYDSNTNSPTHDVYNYFIFPDAATKMYESTSCPLFKVPRIFETFQLDDAYLIVKKNVSSKIISNLVAAGRSRLNHQATEVTPTHEVFLTPQSVKVVARVYKDESYSPVPQKVVLRALNLSTVSNVVFFDKEDIHTGTITADILSRYKNPSTFPAWVQEKVRQANEETSYQWFMNIEAQPVLVSSIPIYNGGSSSSNDIVYTWDSAPIMSTLWHLDDNQCPKIEVEVHNQDGSINFYRYPIYDNKTKNMGNLLPGHMYQVDLVIGAVSTTVNYRPPVWIDETINVPTFN